MPLSFKRVTQKNPKLIREPAANTERYGSHNSVNSLIFPDSLVTLNITNVDQHK